ncbi:MAG: hypothetical protein PHY02_06640 [Phycisphaerae bacterium]|nr:hypothetical protein [Phycisphaerae bacterium]
MKMYDQMFNDINTHIMVVWQSIGAVVGAFAFFALAEKNIISVDIATALILLLVGWFIAHLYDAAYWYNRNLCIIANIEKEFLIKDDLKNIHYYMGQHRPNNAMITHIKIQYALGVGIGLLVVLYHFFTRVVPGFSSSWDNFELQHSLPYILFVVSIIYLLHLRKQRNKSYSEFLKNSPGKDIDTSGIKYGIGHGFKKQKD